MAARPATERSDRAEASEERRAAILRAALECFTEQGYAATSIDDVRRRSGASVGSIYHHFGSKEELFGALYVDGLADYQAGVLAVLSRSRQARAGIGRLVGHHLDWVAANRDLARFLLAGRETEVRLASESHLRELNRGFLAEVRAWLEPHVARGRVRRLPLDLFYALVLGPSQEFARHWLAGTATTSLRSARRALADAAWSSVTATKGDSR